MSVLIVFENKEPQVWARSLKGKLPNTAIEIFPDVKDAKAVDFVICWKPKRNVLKQFPNTKVIQSVGASVDHILNSQTISDDIKITRIVDNNLSNDMWEFLLMVILGQLKNSVIYQNQHKTKIWQQHNYQNINETTIAILGLGAIGAYVAEKFAQLGFIVKGWSNSKKNISNVKSYIGKDELVTCLQDTDYLVNLLPVTNETINILNKNTLQKLPDHAFLINVGRGEHLVESDLIELLDSSKLSGALLDVFRKEPLPKDHHFWEHPKIQIRPHIASLTNVESAIIQITENYNRFLNNKELTNVISIKKGY